MLALPLITGSAGFFYAFLFFILCFLFMLLSLFFLMEANLLSLNANANLITMVKERLGPFGQGVAWVSFLFLLYSVAAAYLLGGGSLISDLLSIGFQRDISQYIGVLIFLLTFGLIVVFGTRVIDIINRYCMIGLGLSFLILIIFIVPHLNWHLYREGAPKYLFAAVPVVVLSFTSHIIVPSLRKYLRSDVHKLKMALFWGSCLPLLFYLTWVFLIVGTLPLKGPYGLETVAAAPHPIAALTHALNIVAKNPFISLLVGLFSFFALLTSFLGVSLSLYDFLADGFHIKKTVLGRTKLLLLMFAVPISFALFYPQGFILALGYAGVFVAILYGILPALMVWHGRYIEKKEERFRVLGGKTFLILMLVGSLIIIFLQLADTIGWLHYLCDFF